MTDYIKKEWIFYATGFFSGMSVMAVELGAQRLLSPYFSSSQIVWTIVIGVIMIAMALGNIIGGKMADKYQKPDRLFVWLFIAATWIILIPLFGKFIIAGIAIFLALFVNWNYLIWASLISCLIVFVFPLMILGMVTPNIVKFATKDLKDNGKIVGKIEAFNTIGSIIGTFIPTFVSIPFVGTSMTFVIFSVILYIICMMYFITAHKYAIRCGIILSCCFIIGIISSNKIKVAFWESNIIYEGESQYNYLKVTEDDDKIIFSTNVLFGVQSVKMKQKCLTGYYYDYAMAAPLMNDVYDKKLEILILGLGTGTYATQCLNYFPNENLEFDGVEIDGKVVKIARKYFDLPDCVDVTVEDGRAFLNTTKKKYDIIMVDAYRDISIPFQMSSQEFFKLVKKHLKEDGNMVVNMNLYDESKKSITNYLKSTIASVFDYTYVADTDSSNSELFASSIDVKEKLHNNLDKIDDSSLKKMMTSVYDNLLIVDNKNLILTDDKAPVEMLGMKALDNMIEEELTDIRKRIKGKNIKEIIEELT
ncbi:MAG: fused MFS/spermidine synthase [Acholeplasmatales bacterium]|nr:fused MFS/spermidine synthase [Acholeplasmatales bacterium]